MKPFVIARLAACVAAASTLPGCSTVADLIGPRPFVQADDLGAPEPQGDSDARARKLFLGVVGGLRDQGKSRASLAFLDEYERSYPDDPDAKLLRADCLLDVGDAKQAEALYKGLSRGEHAAAAHAGLGQVAASQRSWAEAADEFGEAVRLSPRTIRYVNNLGFAEMQAGRYERAEFSLRKAAELDPRGAQARNNLILCVHREGREDEARSMLAAIGDPAARDGVERLMHAGAEP